MCYISNPGHLNAQEHLLCQFLGFVSQFCADEAEALQAPFLLCQWALGEALSVVGARGRH